MTQEEKSLLLQDLSARLPYGVILSVGIFDNGNMRYHNKKLDCHSNLLSIIELDGGYYFNNLLCRYFQFTAKPYLRPMSSMTDVEKHKLLKFGAITCLKNGEVIDVSCVGFERHADVQDYLNSIHIDYRGLIEQGLAIEVTKDNNPYEK